MDIYVKDKYGLGLKKFFEEQNPHARQSTLARLLEVDRQGIHRFLPADRRLLLTEYARSVGAGRRHLQRTRLRKPGVEDVCRQSPARERSSRRRKNVDRAYRKVLGRAAQAQETPHSKAPKPTPKPSYRLSDLRELGNYVITWVDRVRVVWTARSVPWWVWAALLLAYAGAAGFRARGNRSPGTLTLRLGSKEEA